jgi:hypothetical protein
VVLVAVWFGMCVVVMMHLVRAMMVMVDLDCVSRLFVGSGFCAGAVGLEVGVLTLAAFDSAAGGVFVRATDIGVTRVRMWSRRPAARVLVVGAGAMAHGCLLTAT